MAAPAPPCVRARVQVIVSRSGFELDAFLLENIGDRPVRMMQHNQGRKSRSVEIAYQAKCGQMTPANKIAYERKAHSDSFVGVPHLIDFLHIFLLPVQICSRR